ncbi:MAG: methionyl-tRNA formyltransferase [Patescibacteria group bacterium]
MRIVFFGTPDYVLPILKSLHKTQRSISSKSPIVAVVTQKPRPAGRRQNLTYSPVDTWAHKKKIPVYHHSKGLVENKVEADIGVLAAYGEIIPKFVISHLSFDILNVHPSLLPKFRGASPIQATIVSGKNVTGATIMKIDEGIDHGPIISQFKEEVRGNDTTETLRKRLFEKSAEVLTTLLPAYLKGKIKLRQQDHKKATFTTLLKKQHGFIPPKFLAASFKGQTLKADWKIPFMKTKDSQALLIKGHRGAASSAYTLNPNPYTLDLFIRAMQPWPIAWTNIKLKVKSEKLKVKRLKILKAHLEPSTINHQSLVIDEVQLEGKNPVSWKQFRQGYATVTFE